MHDRAGSPDGEDLRLLASVKPVICRGEGSNWQGGPQPLPAEPVVEAFYASSYSLLVACIRCNAMFAHAVEAIEIMENGRET